MKPRHLLRNLIVSGVLFGLVGVMGLGCLLGSCDETQLVVENRIVGATAQNVRFVPDDSRTASVVVTDRLLPGERSRPVSRLHSVVDKSGHIELDLLVRGRRVSLRLEQATHIDRGVSTTVLLTEGSVVTNRAL